MGLGSWGGEGAGKVDRVWVGNYVWADTWGLSEIGFGRIFKGQLKSGFLLVCDEICFWGGSTAAAGVR